MNVAELKSLSGSIRWHRKEIHLAKDENTKEYHRCLIRRNILIARRFYGYGKDKSSPVEKSHTAKVIPVKPCKHCGLIG